MSCSSDGIGKLPVPTSDHPDIHLEEETSHVRLFSSVSIPLTGRAALLNAKPRSYKEAVWAAKRLTESRPSVDGLDCTARMVRAALDKAVGSRAPKSARANCINVETISRIFKLLDKCCARDTWDAAKLSGRSLSSTSTLSTWANAFISFCVRTLVDYAYVQLL